MTIYISAYVLRWVLQIARADFYHPLSQFIVKVTNPLVVPLRRILPGFLGIDWASLVIILLLTCIKVNLLTFVAHQTILPWQTITVVSIGATISTIINVYFYAIMLMAILSWIATNNPMFGLLTQIVRPVLKPFQRLIKPISGFDISPLFAIIALQLLNIVLVGALQDIAQPLQ